MAAQFTSTKGLCAPVALPVDRPGDQLLSRTAFPLNQDVGVVSRHLLDDVKQTEHLLRLAENVVKTQENIFPLFEFLHFRLEGFRLQGEHGVHDGIVIGSRGVLDQNIQDMDL